MKKKFQDPEFRAAHAERMRKLNSTPEARRKNSEGQKRSWREHPERTEVVRRPEVRAKISASVRQTFEERPELAQAHSETMKAKWQDPVYVARVMEARKNSEVFQATRGRKGPSPEELKRRRVQQQEHKETQQRKVEVYLAMSAEEKKKLSLREKRKMAVLIRWYKPNVV
jgi:hypothetical protein